MALRLPVTKKSKRKPGNRAGLTRNKIAFMAAGQMESGGYYAFSMRKLAKFVGVTPTTISAHFKGGLPDLEDEIIAALLDGVAPPFVPNEKPIAYLQTVFFATLNALKGRPTLAMLAIQRMTCNPFVVPKLAERTLASLAALGVAPSDMAAGYRAALQALFALILAGPARAYQAPKVAPGKPLPSSTLSPKEYPHVTKFREGVLADFAGARSCGPSMEEVEAALQKLTLQLGVALATGRE
jgi:AcrR family transcriptional regulator